MTGCYDVHCGQPTGSIGVGPANQPPMIPPIGPAPDWSPTLIGGGASWPPVFPPPSWPVPNREGQPDPTYTQIGAPVFYERGTADN